MIFEIAELVMDFSFVLTRTKFDAESSQPKSASAGDPFSTIGRKRRAHPGSDQVELKFLVPAGTGTG